MVNRRASQPLIQLITSWCAVCRLTACIICGHVTTAVVLDKLKSLRIFVARSLSEWLGRRKKLMFLRTQRAYYRYGHVCHAPQLLLMIEFNVFIGYRYSYKYGHICHAPQLFLLFYLSKFNTRYEIYQNYFVLHPRTSIRGPTPQRVGWREGSIAWVFVSG